MNTLQWEVWVAVAVVLLGFFYYCEQHAAMRGTHR